MDTIDIVLIVIAAVVVLFMVFVGLPLCVCFRKTFYVTKKQKIREEFELPQGKDYIPYHDLMLSWMKEAKAYNREEIVINSFDGLKLKGYYYEHQKGLPIEIMFHGYRGSAERDLCGGIQRCKELGRNALLVEQRGQGSGEECGHVITFGIKERFDAKAWADYAFNRFGDKVPLILTGISMGAATVLMASGLDLPKTVVGIVADCGYDSPKNIICHVLESVNLPSKYFYPFLKLGAKVFGRFNLEETSAVEEVKKAKVPIVFIHGKADDFVPAYMSENNYNACVSPKRLELFEGAGHGAAYLTNPEKYINALSEIEKDYKKLN